MLRRSTWNMWQCNLESHEGGVSKMMSKPQSNGEAPMEDAHNGPSST